MFKIAEKTNVDINSSDVFVSAIVQRLALLVVFKFVNRVMVSVCVIHLEHSHCICICSIM